MLFEADLIGKFGRNMIPMCDDGRRLTPLQVKIDEAGEENGSENERGDESHGGGPETETRLM